MPPETARKFALAGLLIQIALPLGQLVTFILILRVFGALGGGNLSAEAGSITGGVAHALWSTMMGAAVALPGVVFLALGAKDGGLRGKKMFGWSCAFFCLWLLVIGLGTVIGIVGLILLFRSRKKILGQPSAPIP